jgi:hypothetical protein
MLKYLSLMHVQNSPHPTTLPSQPSALSTIYLYQKDERARLWTLQSCKFKFPPPPVINVVSLHSLNFCFFFFSVGFQRVKTSAIDVS